MREGIRELLRCSLRVTREAERARQHARAAARHESDRQIVPLDAVEGFVETAVA